MVSMPVTLSDRAARRIAEILKGETQPTALRLAVTGGGCSGFQYNFALDENRMDDDLVWNLLTSHGKGAANEGVSRLHASILMAGRHQEAA